MSSKSNIIEKFIKNLPKFKIFNEIKIFNL